MEPENLLASRSMEYKVLAVSARISTTLPVKWFPAVVYNKMISLILLNARPGTAWAGVLPSPVSQDDPRESIFIAVLHERAKL